jgi:virulence-associated protein VagC
MGSIILQAETLNLPSKLAVKLRGKRVELIENGDTITITPVNNQVSAARGMFKDSAFGTDALMQQKRLEKELEYGEYIRS